MRLKQGNTREQMQRYIDNLSAGIPGFYKNFEADLDQEAFTALMPLYQRNVETALQANLMYSVSDWRAKADELYSGSIFTADDASSKLSALLKKDGDDLVKALDEDPLYQFMDAVYNSFFDLVSPRYKEIDDRIQWKLKTYMQLQMDLISDKTFYPDANSTLRLTYGQVQGYSPSDAVEYTHVTYLEGVMAKYKPGDYEFDLHPKLISLYERKDYGRYAEGDKMPVCFVASNHTSGGNSGSPALNARGELIGLNFDRVWEGTMSDINYDVSICRNIMVDVRYILFVVDKFAGAGYLIDELEFSSASVEEDVASDQE